MAEAMVKRPRFLAPILLSHNRNLCISDEENSVQQSVRSPAAWLSASNSELKASAAGCTAKFL
jgi:hypothetical protein